MNTRIKNQWIKNLTSGKYHQTKEQLHGKCGHFCCLGVLCDMYIKSKEGKKNHAKWEIHGNCYYFVNPNEHQSGVLPRSVQKWAGIEAYDPYLIDNDMERKTASELNDAGKKFSTIAKLIKENL